MSVSVVVGLGGHLGKISGQDIKIVEESLNGKLKDTATISLKSRPNERWEIEVDFKGMPSSGNHEKIIREIKTSVGDLYLKKFEKIPPVRCLPSSVEVGKVGGMDASKKFLKKNNLQNGTITVDEHIKKLAEEFKLVDPQQESTFDNIVLNEETRRELEMALELTGTLSGIYKKWGLDRLASSSHCIFNFQGAPGTGKTMAVHAIANKLKKKLIIADCPSLISHLVGEGSKRIAAAFLAAKESGAILFFDEADAFVSSRIMEVTTGADHESNSLRDTLLTCFEEHEGMVILTSNMAKAYDKAFVSRMQTFEFQLPTTEMLEDIWKKHRALTKVPWGGDVKDEVLAKETFLLGFSGRDVKNALLYACKSVLFNTQGQGHVYLDNLLYACKRIKPQ